MATLTTSECYAITIHYQRDQIGEQVRSRQRPAALQTAG